MIGAFEKVRTHTYLGDYNCSLTDPTSWSNCLNVFRQARTELEVAQGNVIQLENGTLQMLQDAIQNNAPSEIISANQSVYDQARQVRIDHTSLVNAFNGRVADLSAIPGFDTIFLSGFRPGNLSGNLGRLGQAPFPWAIVIEGVLVFLSLAAVAWAVGNVAEIWTGNYHVAAQQAKTQAECYSAYKLAIQSGQTPPDCTQIAGGSSTTTFLIIGGIVLGAIFLINR